MAARNIVPFHWYNDQVEPAMNQHVAIFLDSRGLSVYRDGARGPAPAGMVLTATFEVAGQQCMAPNGGPLVQITVAIPLVVNRDVRE